MLPPWVFEAEAAEAEAVDRNKLADAALSIAQRLGASYADIRINRTRFESQTNAYGGRAPEQSLWWSKRELRGWT